MIKQERNTTTAYKRYLVRNDKMAQKSAVQNNFFTNALKVETNREIFQNSSVKKKLKPLFSHFVQDIHEFDKNHT